MKRTFYVKTRNFNDTHTVMFKGTRRQCEKFIVGRWGHWPPFATIHSTTKNH